MKKYQNLEQPVVFDKPSHHREVESFHVPGDDAEYYKAYDGDKEVLVPKENLEAMKELINYKMRRRAESKFTRYPDPNEQKKELKRFEEKLEHLQSRMKEYEKTQLEPLMKEFSIVDEVEQKFKMSEVGVTERRIALSVQSIEERVDRPKSAEGSLSDTISMSEEITLPRGSIPDTKSIKFLVSGHFRQNKKPIFIIRQYRGSSIIRRKHSDFNTRKTEKGVDILISGKFYKQSILEETNDIPKNMKFKARKKILIDDRSNILEEGFINLFSVSEFDVVVGGMFAKTPASPHYTPLVSIAIKQLRHSNSRVYEGRFALSEERKMVMSVSTPTIQNPFFKDLRKTRSVPKSEYRRRRVDYAVAHEPQGFKSLLTRIDEGEEAFECPSSRKTRRRSSSKSSTSTQNSLIKKTDEPRENFTWPKLFCLDYFHLLKSKELEDKPKFTKSLSTKSKPILSHDPIPTGRTNYMPNTEELSIPNTSQRKALETTEDNQVGLLAPAKLIGNKNNKQSKSTNKPGFFKRIFKRLFSR